MQLKHQVGRGRIVVATRGYAKGDLVHIAHVIPLGADDTLHVLETLLATYVYEWGDGCAVALGWGSLFAHSTKPNLEWQTQPMSLSIEYYAARRINAGDELVINYGYTPR